MKFNVQLFVNHEKNFPFDLLSLVWLLLEYTSKMHQSFSRNFVSESTSGLSIYVRYIRLKISFIPWAQ